MKSEMQADKRLLHPAWSLLLDFVLFVGLSICWGFINGMIQWFFNIDPYRGGSQLVVGTVVLFLPIFVLALAAAFGVGRLSGKRAGLAALAMNVSLLSAGVTAAVVDVLRS